MTLKIAIFVLFLFFAGTESKSELLKEWLNFVTDIFDWKKAEKVDTKNQMNFEGLEALEASNLGRGINGGVPCAACTILFSMAGQLAQIYNETLVQSLARFCGYLPTAYEDKCHNLVQLLTPYILSQLVDHNSPDTLCYGLHICYVETGGKMCNLFPIPERSKEKIHPNSINKFEPVLDPDTHRSVTVNLPKLLPWICYLPGLKQVCEAIDDAFDKLVPGIDLDGDRHSSAETLRGSIWRGRDCSDLNAEIYPGRRPLDQDQIRDSNCNGVFGVNPDTGVSYEEELCAGSGQRGLIYLGDSVGAHFHVPPVWFTPSLMATGIFSNLSFVVSNEADWPDVGFATGFRNATYMPDLIFDDQVDSIYLRLRNRNLCNHRDYQNLARNGANSNDTITYVEALSRNQDKDHPAIVLFALVGNDVCNEFSDTVQYMTTPEKFYNNTMDVLAYLDSQLPPDSHVILMGLIDGSVLYKAMAKRIHPLGLLRGDLTYDDVYDWFNCMEIGPCQGWMNSNATLRHFTTRRANQLSKVLKTIATVETFDRFDVHFVRNPFKKVIEDWLDQGRELWELIEPVDSLHPTQFAQNLISKELWRVLERKFPFVLGPVNKNNEKILKHFGQQGGH